MARALVVVVEVLGVIPELAEVVVLVRDVPHDVGEGDGSRHASGADLQEPVLARVDVQHGRVRGEVAVASDGAEMEEHARRQRGLGRDAVGVALRPHRGADFPRPRTSPGGGRYGRRVARGGAVAGRESHEQQVAFEHGPYPHEIIDDDALTRVLPLDNGLFQGCARRSARKPSPPARA